MQVHFTITIVLHAGLSPFCCMQDHYYVQNSGCGWVGEFKQLVRCTTVKCWYTPSRREHITSWQMALCKVWLFPQILTYSDSPADPHLAEVPKVPIHIWPKSQKFQELPKSESPFGRSPKSSNPHLAEVPKVPRTPKVRLILTLAIWPISQSPLRD